MRFKIGYCPRMRHTSVSLILTRRRANVPAKVMRVIWWRTKRCPPVLLSFHLELYPLLIQNGKMKRRNCDSRSKYYFNKYLFEAYKILWISSNWFFKFVKKDLWWRNALVCIFNGLSRFSTRILLFITRIYQMIPIYICERRWWISANTVFALRELIDSPSAVVT